MNKKVFLSFEYEDSLLIEESKNILLEEGYDVASGPDTKMGDLIYNSVSDFISASDFYVIFVTPNYLQSDRSISELNLIVGYAKSLKKPILPIIIGNSVIPSELSNQTYVRVNPADSKEIANLIKKYLTRIEGEKLANKEKTTERIEKIKVSITDYIEPTLVDLKSRERKLKTTGIVWNLIGFLALLAGVITSIYLLVSTKTLELDNQLYSILYLGIKGAILLTLLLATSKYAFSLSKSYINESLKVADRIHAISFGKFYIKVFEESLNSNDFKEIFQHWNLTKESSFSNLQVDKLDSKTLESLMDLVKNVKEFTPK
jgi:hypothetical protein